MLKAIDINKIDPSPFQVRKYFNQVKQKELGESIQRAGLIEPIVVRLKGRRYEIIAGERRFRAIRDFTDWKTIPAQIIKADDLKARRISAEENLQREDLSAIETIEAIVEMVDVELIKDKEYAPMGKKPAERVKTLLGKLDSMRRSKERGYKVNEKIRKTSNKFIGRVEKIFKNLPKRLEWLSFLNNDLPLVIDFCKDVQEASTQNGLNGAQTRSLQKLKSASNQEFQRLTDHDRRPPTSEMGHVRKDSCQTSLKEMSAREIDKIADRAVKKENLDEFKRARVSQSLNSKAKTFMMSQWGIPAPRIAARLEINRLTALKYSENPSLVRSVRSLLKKGHDVEQVSKELGCPEPLVWSIALEGKNDKERFKALGWGLRTWDQWFFNDLDRRFGDDWPGQIPAQLVGHTLHYFSKIGHLVFDPMAGGGVVPDVSLAFGRKCWSFDLVDRPETRPEIEPFRWDPERLVWPVNGKEKPDLIFFDPPYFKKMTKQYADDSISVLSRKEYLEFYKELFPLMREHTKTGGRIAFLVGDWRDFQGISAMEEDPDESILLFDYGDIMRAAGWKVTHLIDSPLSTERFRPHMVRNMQKNNTLGVVRRSLIVGIKI